MSLDFIPLTETLAAIGGSVEVDPNSEITSLDHMLLWGFLALALIFSSLCSVFEAVFLSVTPAFVGRMREKGNPAAATWEKLKLNAGRPLSAILILNTVAHTVGAAGVGAQAAKVYQSIPAAAVGGILTVLILVISEIIPKTLGATYWRPWARWVGVGLKWLTICLTPFVWMSEKITSLFGKGHHEGSFNREEFAAMVDIGLNEGKLNKREAQILRNLFLARTGRIEDAMTPRTVVFSLPADTTASEFIELSKEKPFSRVPVYGENRDDTKAFVLKADVAIAVAEDRAAESRPISSFARPIPTVSEQTTLLEMFDRFLAERQHIALAVDEFGSAQGIVTLEDVVETMLGMEIVDESDESVDMQALARDLWRRRATDKGIAADKAELKSTPAKKSA